MSAPEDSTATAQPAPDQLLHQQNVVPATSAASSLSSAISSAPAAITAAEPAAPSHPEGPTAAVATAKAAGSASVTAASAIATAAAGEATPPAAAAVKDSSGTAGASASSLPANNGSNSSHKTNTAANTSSESSESHNNKEVVVPNDVPSIVAAAGATDGKTGSQDNGGSSAPVDAKDATRSSEPDKSDATTCKDADSAVGSAGAAAAAAAVTPDADADVSPDADATIEAGGESSDGPATPTAAEPPESIDALHTKLTEAVSVCGVVGSVSAVTNGAGAASNPSVPVLAGTSSATLLRGRDFTDARSLEYHCRMLEDELQAAKESEARYKQQYSESQRRERILARRVLVQEQEVRDYSKQISELKYAQAPGPAALRSALLDPAVNILFQKLKAELQATKAKLEETQNELSAWKFTPDSNTGKRLMAKCRLLYQENEELGKMTSNGRLAKLESELALQKSYNEEVKKSQLELDDFLQELDEDVEGMQGTIVFLQQELKQTKDARDEMEKEVMQLRAYITANLGPYPGGGNDAPTSGSTPTDERSASLMMLMDGQDSNSNNSHHGLYHNPDGGGGGGGGGPDSIGGGGGGAGVGSSSVGDMGGGVTPIYLVNGGGGNADATGSRLVMVNKSSSSSDQAMLMYSNRTHCGGAVVTGTGNALRTTPSTVTTSSAADSSNSCSTTAAVNGGGGGVGGSIAVGSTNDSSLVHEPKEPAVLPAGSDVGVVARGDGEPDGKITNSSGEVVNSTASKQPQQQQQQQQRTAASNNVGRNGGGGGRTTVAARKRNYNDTELDSVDPLLLLPATGGGSVVSDAHGSSDHVQVMDVGDGESVSCTTASAVANGKLPLESAESQQPQQPPEVETNSNKRMTRSGKGKAVTSSSSSSSVSSAAAATNVLITSAAKKLRRGSIAPEDEVDPLGDAQPPPPQPHQHQQQQQQKQQQTISSANGSN